MESSSQPSTGHPQARFPQVYALPTLWGLLSLGRCGCQSSVQCTFLERHLVTLQALHMGLLWDIFLNLPLKVCFYCQEYLGWLGNSCFTLTFILQCVLPGCEHLSPCITLPKPHPCKCFCGMDFCKFVVFFLPFLSGAIQSQSGFLCLLTKPIRYWAKLCKAIFDIPPYFS